MEFIATKGEGTGTREMGEGGGREREAETLPQQGGTDWGWIELVY